MQLFLGGCRHRRGGRPGKGRQLQMEAWACEVKPRGR